MKRDYYCLLTNGYETQECQKMEEVFQKIEADMTQEFFDKCCDDCRWKKMGICSSGRKNYTIPQ